MFDFVQALETFEGTMTTSQLAKLLGVSGSTVRRLAAKKVLPSILLSGERRFCPTAVKKWYQKQNPR